MDALQTTSFDRYARYLYTYRLRTELLPVRPLRILDVGDPYGTLAELFPHDFTVSVDLIREGATQDGGHQHVLGSGFALPFPDASFDLVTAHDVLEHVPADLRVAFVNELVRVSSGPVVLAAPFADVRTSTCERIVNAYYVAHVGHSLEPLDEHAEAGLPDLASLVTALDDHGVPHVVYSDGWLFHWLAFMLLKAHYVSLGAAALDRATDAAFNRLLRERDARAPHYRRALILRPPVGTSEALGPPPASTNGRLESDRTLLERVARELIAALPRGEDPSSPTSELRRWLRDPRPLAEEVRELATSMLQVLEEAAVIVSARDGRAEDQGLDDRPSVTAVVLDRGAESSVRAAVLLAEVAGIDAVLMCSAGSATSPDPHQLRVVAVEGDDALQLAHAVAEVETEAMLVVDPAAVGVDAAAIGVLLSAYGQQSHCVGYHRPAERSAVQASGLRVDGSAALYVAREFFVISRDLYRAVGGLDGRFQGQLDDVDLGWRLNLFGHRVTSVGPASWPVPHSVVDADVATIWTWIKNFDVATLERVLPAALLSLLAREDLSPVSDLFDGFQSLLRARAEVAQRRVVGDGALRARFGDLVLAPPTSDTERERRMMVRDAFPWPSLAEPSSRVRVLLLADELTHERMLALAGLVGDNAEVTLATPNPEALRAHAFHAVDELDVQKFAEHADVVTIPSRLVVKYRALLEEWRGVVVVDLDAPAGSADEDMALARGDVFICSSKVQRDHWAPHLLRCGRGQRSDDQVDDILRVVVTSSSGSGSAGQSDSDLRRRVVIDLATMPPDVGGVRLLLDELTVRLVSLGAQIAVVGDPDGRHAGLLEAVRAAPKGGQPVELVAAPGPADREGLVGGADVVVRPTPAWCDARLASSALAIDSLALGVPVVTTPADPVADLIAESGAGAVVEGGTIGLADAVVASLADVILGTGRRAASAAVARDLADGRYGSGFRDVVVRPWRWRAAHSGGIVPIEETPAVAKLLDRREVEVTRAVTAALTGGIRAQLDEASSRALVDLEVMRVRLGEMEDELNRVRHEAQRVRSHPLVRVALAFRRVLRHR